MPNFWDFFAGTQEADDWVKDTQQEQSARRQTILDGIANAGSYASEAAGGLWGAVSGGVGAVFEHAARPAGALRAGLLESTTPERGGGGGGWGESLGAAAQGFANPLNVPSLSKVYERPGAEGLEAFGRGVAGFGADIALDPANLLFGMGGVPSKAQKVATGAEKVAELAPEALRGAESLSELLGGGLVVPKGQHIGDILAQTPSKAEEAVRAAARLPVIHQVVEKIAPKLTVEDDPGKILFVLREAEGQIDSQAVPIIKQLPGPYPKLINGRVDAGEAHFPLLRDFLSDPKMWPEQGPLRDFAERWHDVTNDLQFYYRQAFKEFEASGLPKAAIEEYRLQPTELIPGGRYVPRRVLSEPSRFGKTTTPETASTAYLKNRRFLTEEEGRAAGLKYSESGEEIMGDYAAFVLKSVREMEAGKLIAPIVHKFGRGVQKIDPGTRLRFIKDTWLEPDDARALENFVAKEVGPQTGLGLEAAHGLRLMAGVARIPKQFMATGDFATMTLQSAGLLFTHPEKWAQATGLALKAAVKPEVLAQFYRDHAATYAKNPGLMVGAGAEYFEAARGGSILNKVLRNTPGLKQTQQFFEAHLDMGKTLLAESLDHLADAEQVAGNPNARANMNSFVTHLFGSIDIKGMGVSERQRNVESAFVFFANQYTRASGALMVDMLHNPYAQREGISALSSMIAAGNIAYNHVAKALKQEPIFDPSDGRFMTLNLNGVRVGFGGALMGAARAMGKLAANKQLDEDDENPLKLWAIQRAPAPTQILYSALARKGPDQKALQTADDWRGLAGRMLTPFGVSTYFQEAGRLKPEDVAVLMGAQLMGLKSFPEGFKDISDRLSQEQYGKPYADLGPIEQAKIQNTPEIKAIPEWAGRSEGEKWRSAEHDRYVGLVNTLGAQVMANDITPSQLRQKVVDAASGRNERLGFIEEVRPHKPGEPTGPQAENIKAWRGFIETLGVKTDQLRDSERIDEYLASLPPDAKRYVDDKIFAQTENFDEQTKPLMQELARARQVLEPYWEVREAIYKQRGIWERYLAATPAQRTALEQTQRYQDAEKAIGDRRKTLRQRNRTVDMALRIFYGYQPVR